QNGRRVIAVAPSYADFIAYAEDAKNVDWRRPRSGVPDVPRLLRGATKIGGAPVDVVAIDMPISVDPITKRREADDAIARAVGAAGATAHSVNATRPGSFGKSITDAFLTEGVALATTFLPIKSRALIEVFPLAALVRLMRLGTRPPYKVTKTTKYWPRRTKE